MAKRRARVMDVTPAVLTCHVATLPVKDSMSAVASKAWHSHFQAPLSK